MTGGSSGQSNYTGQGHGLVKAESPEPHSVHVFPATGSLLDYERDMLM